MPRGPTSSNTKRSSNHQSTHSNPQNGSLAPPKRQQGRSRASSNATNAPSGYNGQPNGTASGAGATTGQPQPTSLDVPSNGRPSAYQESLQGKPGVGSIGLSANNSSVDLSTATARVHFEGDSSMANGASTPHKRMIDLDQSVSSGLIGLDGQYRTILPSWPLIDSLMLLIILLQLPATLLTLVHLLFASLSFVPHNLTILGSNPATPSLNFGSVSNYIFQGHQGGPSVLTIIISDVIMAMVSMLLWPSARIFLVDLAQAVVALSLGAGSSGTGNSGTMRNAAVCASVVGISQILRERFRIAHHLGIQVSQNPGDELNTLTPSTPSPGSIRSALAVHIVAQGIVKATRRWLQLRDPAEYAHSSSNSSTSSSSHPSTLTTSASSSSLSSSSTNSLSTSHGTSGAKGGTAFSVSNVPKDPEVGCPVTKKKGKQGQWVRGQQPLWAALASSIVHLKEVEKLHAANTTDSRSAVGDGLTNLDEPKVWITRIGSTEIEFGSNYHPLSAFTEDDSVDKRFPFIVELNGIKWPQTTISKAGRAGGVAGGDESTISRSRDDEEWTAEISGLTPTTEYDISFIRRSTGEVIYSTSVGTASKQATNVDVPKEAPPPKPSRPLSPITTLQNSLNSSRNNLEEQKRRIKMSKKTNSRRISSLRSEIDSLKGRLGSGDKGDERARRRALSLKDSVRRAEEDSENFQMELEALQELPEDQEKEWREKKDSWKAEKDNLSVSEKDAIALREQADRRIADLKSETSSMLAKREKAARRVANLRAELERAKTENAATAEEREKAKQREQLVQRRQQIELEFTTSISKMDTGMINFRQRARENYSNIQAMEASFLMQQQQAQAQAAAAAAAQQQQHMTIGGGITATDIGFPLAAQLNQTLAASRPPPPPIPPQQTSPFANHPYGAGPFFGAFPHRSPQQNGSMSTISLMPSLASQNPIVSPFPSAFPGFDRGRSASMFSVDSALTNLSDYDNHNNRKKSLPEGASSGSSSGSDSQEVDGYGNHIATSSSNPAPYTTSPPPGFTEKLKSGIAFPPLPPPSTGHTGANKPEAVAQ